jgi:hypothetical protein
LPGREAILGACHHEIPDDVVTRKGLDLAAVLRLNECLDAFHMPASLLPGNGSSTQAFQVVIEKARSSVRDDGGGLIFQLSQYKNKGILPGDGNAASDAMPNLSIEQ